MSHDNFVAWFLASNFPHSFIQHYVFTVCEFILILHDAYSLPVHLYTDDTQVYSFSLPSSVDQLQMYMSACIDNVAQISCSLMPIRQRCYVARQPCDAVNCQISSFQVYSIMWHHLQSFKTWASIWTLTSACVLKSRKLSHTALVFWGSNVAFALAVSLGLSISDC